MSDQNISADGRKGMIPDAVTGFVLAMCSCYFGWSAGIAGIILGGLAVQKSLKAKAAFDAEPGRYKGEKLLAAALRWSRIGLRQGIVITVVTSIIITLYIAVFVIAGAAAGLRD